MHFILLIRAQYNTMFTGAVWEDAKSEILVQDSISGCLALFSRQSVEEFNRYTPRII